MEDAITHNTVVTQVMDLLATDMDGETVMMNIASGKYYGLDAIGSKIWGLIDGQRSVAELVNALVAEYDVEEGQCYSDTLEFLGYLWKEGLTRLD